MRKDSLSTCEIGQVTTALLRARKALLQIPRYIGDQSLLQEELYGALHGIDRMLYKEWANNTKGGEEDGRHCLHKI